MSRSGSTSENIRQLIIQELPNFPKNKDFNVGEMAGRISTKRLSVTGRTTGRFLAEFPEGVVEQVRSGVWRRVS